MARDKASQATLAAELFDSCSPLNKKGLRRTTSAGRKINRRRRFRVVWIVAIDLAREEKERKEEFILEIRKDLAERIDSTIDLSSSFDLENFNFRL